MPAVVLLGAQWGDEGKSRPTDHPLIVHISSGDVLDKLTQEVPEYEIKLAGDLSQVL